MYNILYERIKEICAEHKITITKLESDLDLSHSSIRRWQQSMPSADKIIKVATYFNISADYLLGRSDIKSSASEILQDDDMIALQRARENMTPRDRKISLQIIRNAFGYAYGDDEK